MADQEGGVPAPNPLPNQQQKQTHQNQDQAGKQQQVVHLNWSNFKPAFFRKTWWRCRSTPAPLEWLDECTSLCTWYKSPEILSYPIGEARLWYLSLEPINIDWPEIQILFRQWYSTIGNTWEQLFHTWRSFNFDENTETIDAYVTQIRHVVTLLGYGEPQILEVFKNTLSTKLYWILFPIDNLRQAVETAKEYWPEKN